jgi:hypothetical protein
VIQRHRARRPTLLVFYPFTRDFIPASFARLKEQLHASKSPSRRRSRCVTGDTQVEIAASRGTQRIARALQIAIYLAHVGFGLSYTHLGEAFGRDRTTIRHACFRIEDARDDFSLDRALSILEGALRLHAQCIPSGEAQ